MVVIILCLIYLVAILLIYKNVLEFVRPGAHYAGTWSSYIRNQNDDGYDGQFDYYIALDPANAPAHLDVPAYRYQRILYPILARVVALGQAPLIPYALVGINLIALAAGTAILEKLLEAERTSPWYALVFGLFAGVFVAVRASTNEPLAYALVLGAILAAQADRVSLTALLLGLAALTKETTLFFAAGYVLYYAVQKRSRAAAIVALGAGVPFLVWQIVLRFWLGSWGIGSGGAGATSFEWFPFNGIWRIATYGVTPFLIFGGLAIAVALIPSVWALVTSIRELLAGQRHPYLFLLLANAIIISFLPTSTMREPLGLFRFLVGLVICVLLYGAWRRARRVLRYSSFWLIFGLTGLA